MRYAAGCLYETSFLFSFLDSPFVISQTLVGCGSYDFWRSGGHRNDTHGCAKSLGNQFSSERTSW